MLQFFNFSLFLLQKILIFSIGIIQNIVHKIRFLHNLLWFYNYLQTCYILPYIVTNVHSYL